MGPEKTEVIEKMQYFCNNHLPILQLNKNPMQKYSNFSDIWQNTKKYTFCLFICSTNISQFVLRGKHIVSIKTNPSMICCLEQLPKTHDCFP